MSQDTRHVSFVYELKISTPEQLIASGKIVSELYRLQNSFEPFRIGDHYIGGIPGFAGAFNVQPTYEPGINSITYGFFIIQVGQSSAGYEKAVKMFFDVGIPSKVAKSDMPLIQRLLEPMQHKIVVPQNPFERLFAFYLNVVPINPRSPSQTAAPTN